MFRLQEQELYHYEEQEEDHRPGGTEEVLPILPAAQDAPRGEVEEAEMERRRRASRQERGRFGGKSSCSPAEPEGCRFNGRPPVSKTGCGGSNPSTPASILLEWDGG